jgi:hypothetical protein
MVKFLLTNSSLACLQLKKKIFFSNKSCAEGVEVVIELFVLGNVVLILM